MATNPNFERVKEFQDDVLASFNMEDPFRLLTPVKVTDGKQLLQRKFAKMPKIPSVVREAVFDEVDKFNVINGTYPIPQFRLDMELKKSEYQQVVSEGEWEGLKRSAMAALVKAKSRCMFQNAILTTGANSFPYYGIIDAGTGNGTYSRPLTCGAATKAGAWTTATYGGSDLSGMTGIIRQFKLFQGDLLLFYPAIVEQRMAGMVPDQTGQVVLFRELAERWYGGLESVDKDDDGTSLLSGVAETATNFFMSAINPSWWIEVYDEAPIVRLWQNPAQDRHYLQLEVHAAAVPIPIEDTDGKVYKAQSYIDTCGA